MRKYLLKPDPKDERDLTFEVGPAHAGKIPPVANLTSRMSPVVDQGQIGSCTANAIASGLREYLLLKNGQSLTRLSRLFLYWHERNLEGTVGEDAGAYIRDGMKTLQKVGVCPEKDYTYDVSHFTATPTAIAEADAAAFKISAYHRVLTLRSLKSSIASGYPVVIGISVYESFESDEVARTGRVPLPDTVKEQCLGGHAMLAVGYDDAAQNVIVRNSWGTSWGDGGYCYLPYSYFTKQLVSDMWTGR